MKVEICVDSVAGGMAAQEGGADRIELCDNLLEGGTTPSAGAIKLARAKLQIGIQVMIRPRGGDFLYSDLEIEVMAEDIRAARDLGVDGVVFGCLTADGAVDVERCRRLLERARPMAVTFHRAFDMCREPRECLEQLIELKVDRVLTSGQEASAVEGLELLRELNRQAKGRIVIMPGGGLTARNVTKIVEFCGVEEVHLSARTAVESQMQFRNHRCFMGGALRPPEFNWKATSPSAVRSVVAALGKS